MRNGIIEGRRQNFGSKTSNVFFRTCMSGGPSFEARGEMDKRDDRHENNTSLSRVDTVSLAGEKLR